MKFKIGDKVYLRKDSEHFGTRRNPINYILGIVIKKYNISTGYNIRVNWGEYSNLYREKDLCHGVPNNSLSRLMYPDYIESQDGKYLIPKGN